jgi:hypothetical protein
MDHTLKPARAVSPGRIMEARGWSQLDLAVIMSRPFQAIMEMVLRLRFAPIMSYACLSFWANGMV